MGVTRINEINHPKILFGIALPQILYNLYEVALSEEAYEKAIKSSLGINDRRIIKLVEVVVGSGREALLLVIYDKFSSEKTFIKDKLKIKVNDFDFDIYHYDFNQDINIENQISLLKKGDLL